MKIIAIGDTHAKDTWKRIVEKEADADKVVFIGDYFDTFKDISYFDQIKNFNEICRLKRDNPNKFVLLMGNHDFHYLPEVEGEKYSGYQWDGAIDIGKAISKAIADGLIQRCYINGDHAFTHAGITQTWLNMNGITDNIEDSINNLHLDAFKFYPEDRTGYGENIHQSPIWVRTESLMQDAVKGLFQIVGHTKVPHVAYNQNLETEPLVMIDCLDTVEEYLEIVNKNFKTKTL